jgi:flagellar hook-associated protein 1 FlgK
VDLEGIESLRSRVLDLQIAGELQDQSKSQSIVNTMTQLQTLFPIEGSGIGQKLNHFFDTLNSLSTNPSDVSLRQNVLSAAGTLVTSFNQTAAQLLDSGRNLDLSVQQDVSQVNQTVKQIADLNGKLAEVSKPGSDYGSFLDQRNTLIQKLSGLIDISILSDGASLTLTTKRGTPLVVGAEGYQLISGLDTESGTQHIVSQGTDITSQINGGEIGGLLQVRDQVIPSLQVRLDTLASGIAEGLNAGHENGYDLYGNRGGALFSVRDGAGAAASLSAVVTDPNLLAASSDGSGGSNGNLAVLSAVAAQEVSNGMTPIQAYGNLVFETGSVITESTAELNASTTILQQLQQQNSAISGVSLDEEASNLLLYQRAYEAAARAISAVDQMLQLAIQLGGNG